MRGCHATNSCSRLGAQATREADAFEYRTSASSVERSRHYDEGLSGGAAEQCGDVRRFVARRMNIRHERPGVARSAERHETLAVGRARARDVAVLRRYLGRDQSRRDAALKELEAGQQTTRALVVEDARGVDVARQYDDRVGLRGQ